MRELECNLAYLEKPDGSVTLSHGQTKVISAVYGPVEVKMNKEITDRATIICILKPKIGMSAVKEKVMEKIIAKTCEQAIIASLHPRSAIQVVLQIVHDSGSLLSCLINAACLSLVHAGLPMRNMIASVCCAVTNNDEYLVDPTIAEIQDCKCVLTFAFESKNLDIVSIFTSGQFTVDQYFQCIQLAKASAPDILNFQRQSVVKFLSKQTNDIEVDYQDVDE